MKIEEKNLKFRDGNWNKDKEIHMQKNNFSIFEENY